MSFSTILLQAGTSSGQGGEGFSTILMIAAIGLVMYFFMIRPQQKKQKEQKNLISDLKKGDKVVTIGGIIGKIVEINEKEFVMETEGGTRLRLLLVAISLDNTKAQNTPEKAKS